MERAFLVGPCVGEMYWEFARFAPYVIFMKVKKYLNEKMIVMTREDRFDIYGTYADIFVPLRIDGDGDKYIADCFRLKNFAHNEFEAIVRKLKIKYASRYQIVDHIFPSPKYRYADKRWAPREKMIFDYKPRLTNKIELDKYLPFDKPIIVLAPRFRKGLPRNWPYWNQFYDLIYKEKRLMENFNFIIIGKLGEYYPDKNKRFYDINEIERNSNISPIGLLIEVLKRKNTILTIGSQSAIPNISLLFHVPVLEWGHEKTRHAIEYNIFKTDIRFIEDFKYNLKPEIIFNNMMEILVGRK